MILMLSLTLLQLQATYYYILATDLRNLKALFYGLIFDEHYGKLPSKIIGRVYL